MSRTVRERNAMFRGTLKVMSIYSVSTIYSLVSETVSTEKKKKNLFELTISPCKVTIKTG